MLTAYNQVVFDYLDKKFGTSWRKEAPKGIFGLDKSLDEFRDYKWFIKTLHKESKYPVKLLAKGKECLLRIEYAVDSNGICRATENHFLQQPFVSESSIGHF